MQFNVKLRSKNDPKRSFYHSKNFINLLRRPLKKYFLGKTIHLHRLRNVNFRSFNYKRHCEEKSARFFFVNGV